MYAEGGDVSFLRHHSVSDKTPVREMLHIWPDLPLFIDFFDRGVRPDWSGEDRLGNIIDALEHHDRVRTVYLQELTSSEFERIITVMQEPFPALTYLSLHKINWALTSAIPDTFLNGSAPSLQCLTLWGLSFPSLPRILSSASGLTTLELYGIPNAGYISPESIATCLSTLTMLKTLEIDFRSATPDPRRGSGPRPPPTRAVLPALTRLEFQGVSEWLEVLAARIDAPLLDNISITFFSQLVLDISQIVRFIQVGHIELSRPPKLYLSFHPRPIVELDFSWPQGTSHCEVYVHWTMLSIGLDSQIYSVVQLCKQTLPLFSNVDFLNIKYGLPRDKDYPIIIWLDDVDPAHWLELFHSFTSVKSLEIAVQLEPFIAAALQELTEESAVEVLPMLEELLFERYTIDGDVQQGIESLVTARQHSDHPVDVYFL
jgi:hypothetical protein